MPHNKENPMRPCVTAAVLALMISFAFAGDPPSTPPADVATTLGTRLAEAFNTRKMEQIKQLFDTQAFGRRAANLAFEDPAMREGFAQGVGGTGFDTRLASAFRQLDETRGSVKFMRVAGSKPGKPIIRFDMGRGGIDYWELQINQKLDGSYRFVDWFQLSAGEMMSKTIAEGGRLFSNPDPTMLERVFGGKIDMASVEKMKQLGELNKAGKYEESLALMKTMPDAIAQSKVMLMTRAMVAGKVKSKDEHRSALAELARRYGDDPTLAFILMDHYFYLHQTGKAIASIQKIEDRVGADGATSVLRAGVYLDAKDFAHATQAAQKGVELEPDRYAGYDALALCYVLTGKHAQAVETYRQAEGRFDYHFSREMFVKDPRYVEFVKSAAFDEWLPK